MGAKKAVSSDVCEAANAEKCCERNGNGQDQAQAKKTFWPM